MDAQNEVSSLARSIRRFEVADRGFFGFEFLDCYATVCSIQESSLATRECIWLGVNSAEPKLLSSDAIRLGLKKRTGTESDNGWTDYPLPQEVHCFTRMHLTREDARDLALMLSHFAEAGELVTPSDISSFDLEGDTNLVEHPNTPEAQTKNDREGV